MRSDFRGQGWGSETKGKWRMVPGVGLGKWSDLGLTPWVEWTILPVSPRERGSKLFTHETSDNQTWRLFAHL